MYFYGSAKNPPKGPLGAMTSSSPSGCKCHSPTSGLGDLDSGTVNILVIGGLVVGGLLYLMNKAK